MYICVCVCVCILICLIKQVDHHNKISPNYIIMNERKETKRREKYIYIYQPLELGLVVNFLTILSYELSAAIPESFVSRSLFAIQISF